MMRWPAIAFTAWAVAASGAAADDTPPSGITVRIEKPVVEAFCDAVFPMTLTGTKKVGVTILGQSLAQDVPWKATVRSPTISIDEDAQTFVAQVDATTTGTGPQITWEGEVTGKLTADYVEKTQTVTVRVTDAVAPVTLGPLRLDLDVSEDVPELSFQLPVPTIQLPDQKKGVRVSMNATIDFVKDAILVSGRPVFEKVTVDRTRSRPQNADRGK